MVQPMRSFTTITILVSILTITGGLAGGPRTIYTVTVCETYPATVPDSITGTLTCSPSDGPIHIISASYGRTDSITCGGGTRTFPICSLLSPDPKARVQALCDGGFKCIVGADNSFFGGDPCLGVYKYAKIVFSCGASSMPTIAANFSSQTGVGNPNVFGEQGSPQMTSIITPFMKQGFTFERLGASLFNIVPTTTVADYKANKNNVADASTWNYGYLQKLNYFQSNSLGKKMVFMITVAYVPTWLSRDGKTTSVPSDMGVWQDIVMKIALYLKKFASVHAIEIWNEPDGAFLTGYGPGSPYPTYKEAYYDIYYYAVKGLRAAGLSIPIGGPAAANPYSNLPAAMLSNSSIVSDISFISYHLYDQDKDEDAIDLARFKAIGTSHGKTDIPVYITEWNFSYLTPNDPLNSHSTNAISYVGRRLVTFLKAGFAGANNFKMSAASSDTAADLNGLFKNNTFTPKVKTYRLMSSILGLGQGQSQIMSTIFNPSLITATVAAVNGAGVAVLCAVNEGDASTNVMLSLSGLLTNQKYNVSVYEASAYDPTKAARQTVLATTDKLGAVVISNISVIAKSVVGVYLSQISNPRG